MSDEGDGKDEGDEKKVGYKKPPQHSRWKKGQCPNPCGRTKGALNFKTEVKRVAEAPVVVEENGKRKKTTTVRAMLLRLREKGLKGDVRCIALFLEYADRILGGLAPAASGDISSKEQAILDAYREEILAELAKEKPSNPDDEDIK